MSQGAEIAENCERSVVSTKRKFLFTYVRPEAGAFGYCEYKLPINSTELVNRLRVEQ